MDTNKTDNTSEIKSAEQTETDSTKNASTPSVEETKQQPNATKAYSDRLNKERAKIKEEAEKEAQLTVAKEAGYDSWEDYQKNKRNEKLTTMGFNPDQIAPVIDEFIQKDPRYIDIQRKEEELKNYKLELEAKEELQKLNSKFGTNYSSTEDIDTETFELYKKGLSLEKAYIAQHFEEINKKFEENAINNANSKNHKVVPESGSKATSSNPISKADMDLYKKFNPELSEDDIISRVNKK